MFIWLVVEGYGHTDTLFAQAVLYFRSNLAGKVVTIGFNLHQQLVELTIGDVEPFQSLGINKKAWNIAKIW